jgi:hypothetical protein
MLQTVTLFYIHCGEACKVALENAPNIICHALHYFSLDRKVAFLVSLKSNGMSSIGYLGRFFETARTAW